MTKVSNVTRCKWAMQGNALYEAYHDSEWGVAVHEDRKHFEFLILEGAQAGLSWLTILQKREGYRRAFANFDPKKVARYDEAQVVDILSNGEVVRNRLKIASAVTNARLFLDVQEEFGSFDNYIWGFVDGKTIQNRWKSIHEVPAETAESRALSADLRKRGFKFVGPVVMYAHMQATGLVNDHTIDCFRHSQIIT